MPDLHTDIGGTACRSSSEEVPTRLPHLTLAQVFNALSYYSDHQDEINMFIERNRIPAALLDPLVQDL